MSYQKLTLIGNGLTVRLNVNLQQGSSFYVLTNVKEMLSALGTRRTSIAKQADHGEQDSLSYYPSRFLPFEVEIHARTPDERVEMEDDLRQCVALKRSQSSGGDDGYIRIEVEDDDGQNKLLYAKIVDMPEESWLIPGRTARSRCRFAMVATDPFLYSQTLTEVSGPEAVYTTSFTLKDGNLKALKDGNLPSLQEEISYGLTVENIGKTGTAPVIIVHGPTVDPVVTNQTTGRMMDLTGVTLLEDERMEIDVASYTITKFDDEDEETDVSSYLTPESDWIFLEPGNNDLVLIDNSPDDLEAVIEVEFRPAWV